jgi:prolyl oligopeptidase PreP (S9A serine peptidase family)
VKGLLDGQLIVTLNEDWTPEGETKSFVQGSVVSLALDALEKDQVHLKPAVVFSPTAQEFQQDLAVTKNHLLLTTLDHVQGRAYVYSLGRDGTWMRKRLPVEENQTISLGSASPTDDRFFVSMEGFPDAAIAHGWAMRQMGRSFWPNRRSRSLTRAPMWWSSCRQPQRMGQRFRTLWCIARTCRMTGRMRLC